MRSRLRVPPELTLQAVRIELDSPECVLSMRLVTALSDGTHFALCKLSDKPAELVKDNSVVVNDVVELM